MTTDNDNLRAWIALSVARAPGGAVASLLESAGSATAVAALPAERLAAAGLGDYAINALRAPDPKAIDAGLAWLDEPGSRLVTVGDDYPALLAETRDHPAVLWVRGDADTLHLPALAVVGSRNPTRGGLDNARRFAAHLAGTGFTIVSGLAQGIDSAAHEGALAAGQRTVAVLGHGPDRVYPAANRDLAHRIAAAGALVTEYPPGTPPRREHFPARNRILSGLALGTLVVEAARQSGSLITARLASEQGREVFAIPGSIHNALARGCHRLIRDGARLVESAADILEELGPLVGHLMQHNDQDDAPAAAATRKRDPDYTRLLNAMGHDPVSADELAGTSGLTIDQVSSMLLILELEGEVEVLQGGNYSRLNQDTDPGAAPA